MKFIEQVYLIQFIIFDEQTRKPTYLYLRQNTSSSEEKLSLKDCDLTFEITDAVPIYNVEEARNYVAIFSDDELLAVSCIGIEKKKYAAEILLDENYYENGEDYLEVTCPYCEHSFKEHIEEGWKVYLKEDYPLGTVCSKCEKQLFFEVKPTTKAIKVEDLSKSWANNEVNRI